MTAAEIMAGMDRIRTLEARMDALHVEVSRHDHILAELRDGFRDHDRWEREYRGEHSVFMAEMRSEVKELHKALTAHLEDARPLLEAARKASALYGAACWLRRNVIAIAVFIAVAFYLLHEGGAAAVIKFFGFTGSKT